MKLTAEDNPETIKRYAHLKAASRWGGARCGMTCPGSSRRCTLARGHRGHHASHDVMGRVVAVWDTGAAVRADPVSRSLTTSQAREDFRQGELVHLVRRVKELVPSVDVAAFLILFFTFVGWGLWIFLQIILGTR